MEAQLRSNAGRCPLFVTSLILALLYKLHASLLCFQPEVACPRTSMHLVSKVTRGMQIDRFFVPVYIFQISS